MRARGGLLGIALVALVCSAPPPASAANRNELTAPQATPTSGPVDTTFALSVQYTGVSPAASVRAIAGGHTIPLVLVDGTATDGRWSASAHFPAGTWSLTFAADAAHGKDPTIAGPDIAVAPLALGSTVPDHVDPAVTEPMPVSKVGTVEPRSAEPTTPVPTAPDAAPVATPSAPPVTAPAEAAEPVRDGVEANAAGGRTHAATGIGVPQSSAGPLTDPQASEKPAATLSGSPTGAARSITPDTSFPDAIAAPSVLEDTATMSIVPGLIAVVAAALLAWVVVALAVRRRSPATVRRGATDSSRATVDQEVAAALHRRTLRRSRMLADDDTAPALAMSVRSANRRSRTPRGHDGRTPPT